METGLSASDVALINDRNNCNGGMWGENGFFWIFALLTLPAMFNGGGWFGGNRNGQSVTEAGLCNAMNFNNLENAVGRLTMPFAISVMRLSAISVRFRLSLQNAAALFRELLTV